MSQGKLLAICLTSRRGAQLQSVEQAEAVAAYGLVGDRYYRRRVAGKETHEVTLIEMEAIAALSREHGIALKWPQARRNLVTQGVSLNDLVDRQFTVGTVLLLGRELCDPCKHLEKLTCKGVLAGLINRGGLRAEILVGGVLRVGDPICERSEEGARAT